MFVAPPMDLKGIRSVEPPMDLHGVLVWDPGPRTSLTYGWFAILPEFPVSVLWLVEPPVISSGSLWWSVGTELHLGQAINFLQYNGALFAMVRECHRIGENLHIWTMPDGPPVAVSLGFVRNCSFAKLEEGRLYALP